MSEAFDIYTLLFLVLAVVIFLRLRNVLGRRTGNERPPYDPYSARENDGAQPAGQDRVVPLPRGRGAASEIPSIPDIGDRLEGFAKPDSPLGKALTSIIKADPTFDPAHFLEGAKAAYEMIVMAFAEGDKRALRQLLSRDVYDGFVSAISERENRGETVETSFVGIDKAEIIDAELKKRTAHVTVKFVSQLITATRDKAGKVIDGDPKKVREVTDIWTFARDVSSRDPNWKLVATEAAH
ncbi:MAG: Tim44/TimA family putative adaptor protein [Methyloligellaceae bacterium]